MVEIQRQRKKVRQVERIKDGCMFDNDSYAKGRIVNIKDHSGCFLTRNISFSFVICLMCAMILL